MTTISENRGDILEISWLIKRILFLTLNLAPVRAAGNRKANINNEAVKNFKKKKESLKNEKSRSHGNLLKMK